MAVLHGRLRSVAIASLSVALATGLKLTFNNAFYNDPPFALYGAAVLAAGAFGGTTAAILAWLLSTLAGWYCFVPRSTSFVLRDVDAGVRLVALFAEGLIVSLISWRLEATRGGILRSQQRLEKLHELMDALSTALTREDVANIVVDSGMRIASADACTLYVPHSDGSGALQLIADRGVARQVLERVRYVPADGRNPVFAALRMGTTLWAENEDDYAALYPELARTQADGPLAQAFWSVPLIAESQTVGLLAMGFYGPRSFPPAERAFVHMLARHCAQALRRSERLEAERVARESAERLWNSYETTLRSIGDAVIVTDPHSRVTLMNHVAEELTGFPEAEAKGRPLAEVFHIVNEYTRAIVESPVERVLREGVTVGLANHTMLLHRNGRQEAPIDDSGAPIRDAAGDLDGVVLVFRDVGAKKHAERRAALLTDASDVLSETLDHRAALERVAALCVPLIADICAIDVTSPDGSVQRLALAVADPSKIPLLQALQDKRLSDPAALTVPLLARGRAVGALTLVYNASSRNYQHDDVSFAESLAHRCATAIDNARLYAAEQQARQAADLANRTKDEFLAIMGHELRNPLAPMVHAVHLMRMRLSDEQEAQEHKELAILERQLRHMLRLIEDLLDLSRILRDKVELARESIEISVVLADAAEVAAPLIQSRRQQLRMSVPTSGLAVDVDPTRLAQVFGNLLINAAKYSDHGGEIRVSAEQVADSVVVAVEDNGVGIEPELMPRLFELFSQGKQGIDRQLGGLGIGLAIANRLVTEHAGELTVHSEGPGRGSRFTVRLPRAQTDAEPATAVQTRIAVDRPLSASKRVLIVDDNEDACELMATLVQKLGHATQIAFEGKQALALAESFKPDVVFLDIGLPNMNGFEVARRMRQLPGCREIPIVAVTGYTREADRTEAAQAGFTEHFAKPIGLERLRSVLDAVVVSAST